MKKFSVRDGKYFSDSILEMDAKNHYEVITYLLTNYKWLQGKEIAIENVYNNEEIYIITL